MAARSFVSRQSSVRQSSVVSLSGLSRRFYFKARKEADMSHAYRSLIIFCIVSAIATLSVLLGVFAVGLPHSRAFVITLFSALLCTAAALTYNVFSHESMVNTAQSMGRFEVVASKCPDLYSTSRDEAGNVLCSNFYHISADGHSPAKHHIITSASTPQAQAQQLQTFNLTAFNKQSAAEMCKHALDNTHSVSWTHLSSQCDALAHV
jgi:hypothetical protein